APDRDRARLPRLRLRRDRDVRLRSALPAVRRARGADGALRTALAIIYMYKKGAAVCGPSESLASVVTRELDAVTRLGDRIPGQAQRVDAMAALVFFRHAEFVFRRLQRVECRLHVRLVRAHRGAATDQDAGHQAQRHGDDQSKRGIFHAYAP